ncbi:DUF2490 domain-containing protein [Ferruginibacter yonginensis]|uniref:DUF2490 domain-containing protein n=1 Tax=Ferruginibacter yonginensis TaxID=1310416 RepID=A0ABV8QVX9_9BACT
MKALFTLLVVLFFYSNTSAQNNRLNTHNNIGWYNYFGTIKLNKKWGIHTEYQWRRADFITKWQQSLLRVGVNYQATPNVLLRAGYGWIETFAYGDIPLNGFGKDFTEHRIFEMAQLSQKEGIVDMSHRFMLEQRFVGRYTNAALNKEDDYPLLNRFRYMFRAQLPLKGKKIINKTPYFAVYDEVFIGFGKKVNANVFDQNRIGLLLGYRFNDKFRLEGGFLNQTVQYGRQINGRNVFQYNNGIILNSYFNFDLSQKNK